MQKSEFDIILKSQLGPRSGKLLLQEEERGVYGALTLLGFKNFFSDGSADGSRYVFSGTMRTTGGDLEYDALLHIDGGLLYGGIITRKGCWELSGTPTHQKSLTKNAMHS